MQVRINGEVKEVRDAITIADLLKDLAIQSRFIAVALNREVIPRASYLTTTVREGDTIEIVQPVSGGKRIKGEDHGER